MNTRDWEHATPEQRNLWSWIIANFPPASITPLYYIGAIAGSEFVTYNINKLYVATDLSFDGLTTVAFGGAYATLFDKTNNISFVCCNSAIVWNVTGAAINYLPNVIILRNVYFSRVTNSVALDIAFNGYRLQV